MPRQKSYATSTETKNRIMDTCKKLFIEKGYKQTTYNDICEIAKVHPGTITYHFGSKKKMASILYYSIVESIYHYENELFFEEDDLQQLIIGNGIHIYLLFNDPIYCRFSSEFCSEDLSKDDLPNYIHMMSKAFRVTANHIGEKRAKLLFTAIKGMDTYIEPYIYENIKELTYEEIFSFICEMYYPFTELGEIKKRVTKAMMLLENYEIKFADFQLVLSPK